MFNTKDIDTSKKGKISKYITYGSPQKLKINSLSTEEAKTGSKRVVFHMETEPIKTEGFEGENGSSGQVGRVRTIWLKTKDQEKEFATNISIIADKLGVRKEVDTFDGDENTSIEDFIAHLNKVITNKYLYWAIKGEEYPKMDNGVGISLSFRRFGFVASLEEGENHLKPFDKMSTYDFVPYKKPEATSDLPF